MKKPKVSKLRTAIIVQFFIIALLIVGLAYVYGQNGNTFIISEGIYPAIPDYTIWQEGSTYYSKNENGLIAYQGTNLTTVIESSDNALGSEGGIIVLKDLSAPSTISLGANTWVYEFNNGWEVIRGSRFNNRIVYMPADNEGYTIIEFRPERREGLADNLFDVAFVVHKFLTGTGTSHNHFSLYTSDSTGNPKGRLQLDYGVDNPFLEFASDLQGIWKRESKLVLKAQYGTIQIQGEDTDQAIIEFKAGGKFWEFRHTVTNNNIDIYYEGVRLFSLTNTGDIRTFTDGKGIIVNTPDGTKNYRISVDNAGNIITTQV